MLTAVEDDPSTSSGTEWHYTYDGNGSLIQTDPGAEVANGSTRYTYNTAGYLIKVENYSTEWQTQSEMTYDGLGNRLEVTTYTDGEGNTTRYVLDGGTELTAIGAESSTYYLYGLGVVGTLGESWSYILPDGAGSTRQLVDEEGAVQLSVSYTPWGDTMEIYGSGMLNLGYLGGVYDAGTGLIYMGNGQYYDPSTGRFLTRGAQQDQSNPYTPWNSDPAGMLIAPLALLALVFGRKKTRTKFDQFVILFVIVASVGLSVSACGNITISVPTQDIPAIQTNAVATAYQELTPSPTTEEKVLASSTEQPTNSLSELELNKCVYYQITMMKPLSITSMLDELVEYIFDNNLHPDKYVHGSADPNKVAGYLLDLMNEASSMHLNTNHLAYIYATTHLESQWFNFEETYNTLSDFDKYEPDTPLGKQLGNILPNDGERYRGRGFIHLTGRGNYIKASENLNRTVTNPEGVQEWEYEQYPARAAYNDRSVKGDYYNHITKIAVHGMAEGWFTTNQLSDYDNVDGTYNWDGARAIINWDDGTEGSPASTAAKLGQDFASILENHCFDGGLSVGLVCIYRP